MRDVSFLLFLSFVFGSTNPLDLMGTYLIIYFTQKKFEWQLCFFVIFLFLWRKIINPRKKD